MKFKGVISINIFRKEDGILMDEDYFLKKDPKHGSYESDVGWVLERYIISRFPKQDMNNCWQTCDRLVDYALENPPPELPPFSFFVDDIEYVMVFYA
jgi:hypothetical protein